VFHHTSQKTSRRDVEAPETLESLGSFKVSVSVSEDATSRLVLGQNFERLGLEDMHLGSRFGLGSEVSCTSLLEFTVENTVNICA